MFMNFVLCTNSIQDLITINTAKLNATRKHIGLLRDIVVSRAVRINQHRLKKERVQ
jgi:aspartate carbamoyltransferase catalytic subunit